MKKSTMVGIAGAVISVGALIVGAMVHTKESETEYATLSNTDDGTTCIDEDLDGDVELYFDEEADGK